MREENDKVYIAVFTHLYRAALNVSAVATRYVCSLSATATKCDLKSTNKYKLSGTTVKSNKSTQRNAQTHAFRLYLFRHIINTTTRNFCNVKIKK